MTMTLESRGVRTIPVNNEYVDIYSGEAYLRNLNYLIQTAGEFAHRNIGWSPRLARFMMMKGLDVDNIVAESRQSNDEIITNIVKEPKKEREIPNVILFKGKDAPVSHDNPYYGISIGRMFFIQSEVSNLEEPVFYHILRAFEGDQRDSKRGRFSVGMGLALYRGLPKWYIHRTGNPIAAYTNTRSDALDQEQSYPWSHFYNENPLAYEIARKVFKLIRVNGEPLEPTGVSRGDYLESNKGFDSGQLRGGALDVYNRMVGTEPKDFKMDLEAGDALIATYRVN